MRVEKVRPTRRCAVKEKVMNMRAEYAGLRVEVISRMDHCSLICFKGRKFVVDTADLSWTRALGQAA